MCFWRNKQQIYIINGRLINYFVFLFILYRYFINAYFSTYYSYYYLFIITISHFLVLFLTFYCYYIVLKFSKFITIYRIKNKHIASLKAICLSSMNTFRFYPTIRHQATGIISEGSRLRVLQSFIFNIASPELIIRNPPTIESSVIIVSVIKFPKSTVSP